MGTVSIFVCLHVGRGCVYSFACMRVGTFACVYGCLFRLRLCVRSGLRLHLTHHLSRPPPHHHALPWRMPPVRWWFLAPGQDARVSAGHSRRSLGGAWPYWPCWAPIGGWGAFGSPGPGPGLPWCGRRRWSLRACRHGTLGHLHCGCRRSHLRALLCPFLGGGQRFVPAVVLLGVPCPGGPPDVWGPDLFHACFMPCGMGLLFPTHTIKHLHGGTL